MNMMKGGDLMRLKQSVNLFLIALFIWAFQSTAIHSQHHILEEMSECSVCYFSEQMDLQHNNSTSLIVTEDVAVNRTKCMEKIVFKTRFDYTDASVPTEILRVTEQLFLAGFLPLGFNATAPPTFI